MKRFLFISLFILASILIHAQGFNKAIGLRGGISSGFEYRFFTDDANSYKFLLSARDRDQEIKIHAFKEFHQYDLFEFSDQLVFFYGAGVHVGFETWKEPRYNNNLVWYDSRSSIIAGLDALAGLEYVFYEAPVSIGLEAKPYFDLFGRKVFDLQLFDFAFTVKYLF